MNISCSEKPHRYLKFALIILSLFVVVNNLVFAPGNILSWDVFGYYLYLPLTFIYNDLGIRDFSIVNQIIETYENTGTFYQATITPEGTYVLKYPMGLSFFYAPFFFIGYLIAILTNYPADGFSLPFQYSVFVGCIIYSLLGLWALSKVLLRFFNERTVIFILFIVVFSSNFIVHVTMYGQNSMSHSLLFMTYSFIIWLSILWHESYKIKYIIFLAIICGITILSRPTEIVCLLIPALWGVNDLSLIKERISLFLKYRKQIIVFALILFLFGLFQMTYWKIHTGSFIFYSYGGNPGEGFDFFSPYLLKVLFSFRKGWLIYTPVMIFAIAGFYFLHKKNRSVFYALFIYFIVNLYIVSSWSCWWYAQSFGQRSLIQSYPVMAISLGYFLIWLNNKKLLKRIIYPIIIVFVFLNIFQTRQYHYGIIDGDRMTREYYFKVFGKIHTTEQDKELLLIQRSFDGVETFNNNDEYKSKFLNKLDFENTENKDSSVFYSGQYSFKLDSNVIYTPKIESSFYDITNKDHAWIEITAYVYPTEDVSNNPFCLVAHFSHRGKAYKYKTFDSENMELEVNKWNKISFYYLTPEVRRKTDMLSTYVWHRGKYPIYIDDLEVNVYEKL